MSNFSMTSFFLTNIFCSCQLGQMTIFSMTNAFAQNMARQLLFVIGKIVI